ncbi:MAG TPA: c-type cytochrome [Polyangiaceae bacterium]|nr:c-type cytochrome [Polyangiaceae bacterium]
MSRSNIVGTLALLIGAAIGCQEQAPVHKHNRPAPTAAAPAPAPTTTAVAGVNEESLKLFKSRCVVCHGDSGQGNGPGAAALNPKPRDYTNKEWQAAVSDDQIRAVILMGGAAVGKSPIMPANPDLQAKEDVVNGLVKIVRAFNTKG